MGMKVDLNRGDFLLVNDINGSVKRTLESSQIVCIYKEFCIVVGSSWKWKP
jgi:hypothetical protein